VDDSRLAELRTVEVEPRARGAAMGSMLGEQIEVVLRSYLNLFEKTRGLAPDTVLRLGDAALTRVSNWQPRMVEEMEGVAYGAGVAPELIGALNARTEIAREGGCSLLARVDAADGPWLAQNWDWYVDSPERCVVWTADLADGERFVTMTEAGILAKLGLSSRGLAVGLNILHHRRDGGPMGVPVHLILRALLELCTTVEDAAALLGDSPTSGSSAVTVVDAEGGGAVFELSPSGVARLDPRSGFLAHTNHFVDPGLGDGEASELDLDGSRARLELLETTRPETLEEAEELLRDHGCSPESLCRHDTPSATEGMPAAGTIVSVASETAAGRFHVAAGHPCTHEFVTYEVARVAEPLA
jgi:isopenicillin-N N-acyltransferase-like protein